MAAKQVTLDGSVLQETVGINLNIYRNPIPGPPPTVNYSIGFSYGDHTYLVDTAGNKTKLLSIGENTRGVSMTPEKVAAFLTMPITEEMVGGTLGDLIADLWDEQIQENLASGV